MPVSRFLRALAGVALLACIDARATPVGELHRVTHTPTAALRDSAHSDAVRVTVWYPAAGDAIEQPLRIGPSDQPLFDVGRAAPDAPIATGRHPVILLSHGFGGTARIMGWFGTALARHGYVVIAVDHPGNNGRDPMTLAGSTLVWGRALDLRAAWDAMRRDPQIGPHLDARRLGVAGFSLGGFTVLLAGGARADLSRFQAYCAAHAGSADCAAQEEAPDQTMAARRRALADPAMAAQMKRDGDDYAIPGVRAVFAMAPAVVQGIDLASLRRLTLPVAIVLGDADPVAPPATNGMLAARLLSHATLDVLPTVGHYDFLADCTAAARTTVPPCMHLRAPQQATHATAIADAVAFFGRTLDGPP